MCRRLACRLSCGIEEPTSPEEEPEVGNALKLVLARFREDESWARHEIRRSRNAEEAMRQIRRGVGARGPRRGNTWVADRPPHSSRASLSAKWGTNAYCVDGIHVGKGVG